LKAAQLIPLFLSILSILVVITNFVLSIFDRGKKTKEESAQEESNQKLIEYQLKELKEDYKSIASDIKEIKKMLDNYRETFRSMIKDEMNEHVKMYHQKEM
jgi:uncharacterized protein YlxW (UPF0749 family)